MDANIYALAAVLNGLLQNEHGLLTPEAEFKPFDLSVFREGPQRDPQGQKGREADTRSRRPLEAVA